MVRPVRLTTAKKLQLRPTPNMYLDEKRQSDAPPSAHGGTFRQECPAQWPAWRRLIKNTENCPGPSWYNLLLNWPIKAFRLPALEANGLNNAAEDFKKYNTILPVHLLKDNWQEGDTIRHADLAATLERIRDNGKAGFYEGKTADDLIAEMKRGNGLITYEDLKNYAAVWRAPLTGHYKEYKIISMPPPLQRWCGTAPVAAYDRRLSGSPLGGTTRQKTAHLMVEAERRAYGRRGPSSG
ncbi:MAG: hypothetical protein KatS3mg032_0157 [Cyclobacteriaceae bacterium]|nr:MAG: hypothetical protein KatS3mg032_0157 [Cyclobacteriaceae bacterium]